MMMMISRRIPPLLLLLIAGLRCQEATAFACSKVVRKNASKSASVNPRSVALTLSAKPKKKAPSAPSLPAEMPANLKRRVDAKRPPLGHVVPRAMRSSGGTASGAGGTSNPRLRPQGKARDAGINNPSLLKILGGSARGRRLDSPPVHLRPMMGKVKEAVYSALTSFGLYDGRVVPSCRHLDAFAGSGSVGLESLSRGAASCTFVDLSPECCAAVRRNLEKCRFGGGEENRAVCADALQALRAPASAGIDESLGAYQIVTLCPPYEEVVYADLLDAAANSPVVGEDTIVLIEYPVELEVLPHVVPRRDGGALIGVRNRKYGRTVIAMYICNPSGKLEAASSRPEEFV